MASLWIAAGHPGRWVRSLQSHFENQPSAKPMPLSPSKSRAFVTVLVFSSLLYFLIGGLTAALGKLEVQTYALIGGMVGSVASILGLVSLSRPSITQTDLQQIESQCLKSLAETTEDIRRLEEQRTSTLTSLEVAKVLTREQIDALNRQKQEMELLVRKASLCLFLQEQQQLYTQRIQQRLSKSPGLTSLLDHLRAVNEKLVALDAEIKSDPNVELLLSIIEAAKGGRDEPLFSAFGVRVATNDLLRVAEETFRSLWTLFGVRRT
jgi:hypothetical protein